MVLERLRRAACAWPLMGCAHCTSAMFTPEAPAFTVAEMKRALAPLSQLEQACYTGSASQRAQRKAHFEFIAYVNKHGRVHADPQLADVRDPALSECLRTGIEALSFPDTGGADQFRLRFDLALR